MNHRESDNSALTSDELAVKQALTEHLDQQVQNLDFNVTSRLAAARHRALAQQPAASPRFQVFSWQSLAGSVAALSVAYLIGSQMLTTTTLVPSPQLVDEAVDGAVDMATGDFMEDLTILAEGDDIEFYQNIEFLEWLENNS